MECFLCSCFFDASAKYPISVMEILFSPSPLAPHLPAWYNENRANAPHIGQIFNFQQEDFK